MKKVFFSFFCLLMITAFLVGGAFLYMALDKRGRNEAEQVIVIPAKSSLHEIALLLKRYDLIPAVASFKIWGHIFGAFKPLQAGEYKFSPPHRLRTIISKLQRGETIVHRFTVVEGVSSAEIISQLQKEPALKGKCITPNEGTLLPETYHFSYGDKREDLIKRMEKAFQKEVQQLWRLRSHALPYKSIEEAVTLASLVEKETSLFEERPRIAAVFLNRLRLGMPLQCDASVLYGLYREKRLALNRHLSRTELKIPTAYNTYLNKGLPPRPICNPGLASLKAVFSPLATNELYFVANGKGGHEFSSSYQAHSKHHKAWRQIRKKTG